MLYGNLRIRIALVSFWLILGGCDHAPQPLKVDSSQKASEAEIAKPVEADAYRFGFDLRSSPQEDSRQYQPLLDYLSNKTGLKFTLAFVRSDKPVAEQLASGAIDFAAAGAVTTIAVMRAGVAEPLVRGLSKDGHSTYRAAIVIPINSNATNLSSLKGKRLALGAESSTQGNLIPRLMLKNAQLSLGDFSSHIYTGSHLLCAQAVMNGQADACGMQGTMAAQLAEEKKLRVLQYSDEFPSSGIIAAERLPSEIRSKVKQALLEFSPEGADAPGLYHWERTEMPKGFIAANADDYRIVGTAMSLVGISGD